MVAAASVIVVAVAVVGAVLQVTTVLRTQYIVVFISYVLLLCSGSALSFLMGFIIYGFIFFCWFTLVQERCNATGVHSK